MARKPEAQTQKQVTIPKCKFAGDDSDEYCKACNGIAMKVEDNGPEIPCSQCGGYEVGDQPAEETQSTVEGNVNPTETEEAPFVEDKKEDKAPAATTKSSASTAKATQQKSKPAEPATSKNEEVPDTTYQSKAVVTEIRADSGVSCELKDKNGVTRWYKFNYGETRSLAPDANYDEEVDNLWKSVNDIVDNQVAETVDFLNS